jgi:1,4-alpha-glucan branching enzyme
MLKREIVKQSNQIKVTFAIPHNPEQPRVYVAGDFNEWETTATPLVKRPNNTRSASVMLESGKRYKFRYYQEDGTWLNEESADAYEPNEHGSQDCVLIT